MSDELQIVCALSRHFNEAISRACAVLDDEAMPAEARDITFRCHIGSAFLLYDQIKIIWMASRTPPERKSSAEDITKAIQQAIMTTLLALRQAAPAGECA